MSLDTASVKFCCAAKALGVNFRKTLMIGRQHMAPDVEVLQRIFDIKGVGVDAGKFLLENKYGEEFFKHLGAEQVDSLDYSDFEGASIIHDMNNAMSENLAERFTTVYDGGTIEHVFNLPQALKNCMEMVEVGGHFVQVNVANNFMGHGFWQISPELIFRALSPENGFRVEKVLLHELVPGGKWYLVSDPDLVHERVTLTNIAPTYILTIAKRVARLPVFASPPLQSDYTAAWRRAEEFHAKSTVNGDTIAVNIPIVRPPERGLRKYVPKIFRNQFRPLYKRLRMCVSDPFAKSYYREIYENDLLFGRM